MKPHIVLDLSRLLWRAERFAPTGIDRVELAYARHLIASVPERLSFSGWWGRMTLLPYAEAAAMIALLDKVWSGAAVDMRAHAQVRRLTRRLRRRTWIWGEASLKRHIRALEGPILYLQVSHYRLHRPDGLRRIAGWGDVRFIFLVHDLIPIHLPEHVPPGHDERHHRRMETVMRLGHRVIANSTGTAAALERMCVAAGLRLPIHVAPLGLDLCAAPERTARPDDPYFVCLSTIEPRKNHKLLLRVWENLGDRAPRLLIIGRPGWNSGEVLRAIAGSPTLRARVSIQSNLPDSAVAALMAGARAVLNASFAEGFGLPVAEALALGAPVLCSDLAELREVGSDVPEYLDPRDEAAWRAMIADYAHPQSPRRSAQLARLSHWRAPEWRRHFEIVSPIWNDAVPLERTA